MKRSHEPISWSLFGAGGVLSALFGPVLIFVTGIAVPLGLLLPTETMSYAHALAFAQHPLGKLALLVVISLFLYHGCHRMAHSLHDIGIRTGEWAGLVFYTFATLGTAVTLLLLIGIGF